ncbi:Omp28-related outer membrane protein [Winogradskyella litoriviva]|uniref:Omp28-related outer membrane protein n=1 Tax=Winogradskyella litoriviva TaxID=1220182 RepID=A0ABX2E3Y6_9FLAO|nr:Omp28-related outer membrane protein [Winogradskyella litoriviva]NRD23195.1 Omp28-related outer membrane protein [Winogradskyella litoriviva]
MISKKVPKIFLLLFLVISVSCSKTEENVPLTTPTAQISVDELVRKASLINQEIPFKIVNEAGEDVTSLATFYVDGDAIDGSSFSSDAIGEFEVYGVYMEDGVEVTTNTENFTVIIPKRKIVVEDYTGTWCGFCPRVSAALTSLHQETDDITVIAIHETANSYPDPMHFSQVQTLKDAFNVEGFPAAKINRTTEWQNPHANTDVTSIAGLDTNLAIAINSELEGDELTVQVNVVYEEGSVLGDKLVVYLLEDEIINGQVNYYNGDSTSPFYNMGDVIPEFEHNEVLRNSLSAVLGDAIPVTSALTEYITSFTMTVPSDYVMDNLSIAAMVVDSNNSAKNSQFAHIEEDKAYE